VAAWSFGGFYTGRLHEVGALGTNTRLRWTFHPRGDLFVIYNHNVRELEIPTCRPCRDLTRGYRLTW
jgi:hypothetical protein